MAEPNVLVMVLAGGEGKRLLPLTNDRAKPAVPFGGTYRLIDFVLSNFANAGQVPPIAGARARAPAAMTAHSTRTAVRDELDRETAASGVE